MSTVDIYADEDFGKGPGLEIHLKHVEKEQVVVRCLFEGRQFRSYCPTTLERAVEACGYLIRGCEPPRALFRRDRPAG